MYYILETDEAVEPGAYSASYDGPDHGLEVADLLVGKALGPRAVKKVELRLYEYERGDVGIPDYFDLPVPIMSKKMLAVLEKCGLDNLQTFPVVLRDPKRDTVLRDYKIVNIVGAFHAADMNESEYVDMGGAGKIAVGFRNLVVDEEKAKGALLFRLAESLSTILVHESLKEAIENGGLKYIRFIPCAKQDADEEFNVDDYDWDD